LGAFVEGSANLMASYGIPANIALAIMGVFLVSFAATTLDSATRIQRYVVGELAQAYKMPALSGAVPATLIAVGALALWPLFGTVNQLLAALALLIITVYLARKKVKAIYTGIPMVFMIAMTGWAMVFNLQKFYAGGKWLLFVVGLIVFVLEIWMIA
ncbi:carbon starvation protein A, partial [Aduncisulcus paluster]